MVYVDVAWLTGIPNSGSIPQALPFGLAFSSLEAKLIHPAWQPPLMAYRALQSTNGQR
jgi:hypothetical protein